VSGVAWRWERATDTYTLVSLLPDGSAATVSSLAAIAPDGRSLLFRAPEAAGLGWRSWRRDLTTGVMTRLADDILTSGSHVSENGRWASVPHVPGSPELVDLLTGKRS
jgi:hypothetical protein